MRFLLSKLQSPCRLSYEPLLLHAPNCPRPKAGILLQATEIRPGPLRAQGVLGFGTCMLSFCTAAPPLHFTFLQFVCFCVFVAFLLLFSSSLTAFRAAQTIQKKSGNALGIQPILSVEFWRHFS